jgi:hypothetical protein
MKQVASQPRGPNRNENQPVSIEDEQESRIRVRAYELYVERGMAPDHEVDDWLQAEQEIRSEAAPLARRTAA